LSPQNKSTIYFTYKGIVWKLLADPESALLFVETRDEASRKADFAAIDLSTQKQLWNSLSVKESWWVGLEEAKNGYVILHGYKDIQNPEHMGVFVFDGKTGTSIWENSTYTFVSLNENQLLAYDPSSSEKVFKRFSIADGKELETLSETEFGVVSDDIKKQVTVIQNPLHYTIENMYFDKIAKFVEAYSGLQPETALDYLEYKNKIIVSFYSKVGEKMVNYLLVVNEEGEILYNESIGSELNGIGLDSFFLFKELLIFVKNKKELVILGV
jgi:hypothetical protein